MSQPFQSPSDDTLLRDVLADAARARDPIAGRDAHLDADTLVAYHKGSLGDDDARRARDHMVACATCAGLLTDLNAGFEDDREEDADADNTAHSTTLEIERDATWRALQAALQADCGTARPAPTSTRLPRAPRPRATARTNTLPWALAAILLATVAGLAWRLNQITADTNDLRAQIAVLDTPQAEVAIAYLDTLTRDIESETTVAVGPNRPLFLLILTPPLDDPERAYRVELFDATGDEPHWSSGALVVNDHGTLRVALSRRFVAPGHYRVRLLGIEGTLIDERTLRVIDGA